MGNTISLKQAFKTTNRRHILMQIAQIDILQAVTFIQTKATSPDLLGLLDRIISRREGSLVISELISRKRAAGATDYDAITRTLADLESVASTWPTIGCTLMASLWPIAGKCIGMHDVPDAINLWMENCKSKALADQLTILALSENDAGTRRHYEQWIQRMAPGADPTGA